MPRHSLFLCPGRQAGRKKKKGMRPSSHTLGFFFSYALLLLVNGFTRKEDVQCNASNHNEQSRAHGDFAFEAGYCRDDQKQGSQNKDNHSNVFHSISVLLFSTIVYGCKVTNFFAENQHSAQYSCNLFGCKVIFEVLLDAQAFQDEVLPVLGVLAHVKAQQLDDGVFFRQADRVEADVFADKMHKLFG